MTKYFQIIDYLRKLKNDQWDEIMRWKWNHFPNLEEGRADRCPVSPQKKADRCPVIPDVRSRRHT